MASFQTKTALVLLGVAVAASSMTSALAQYPNQEYYYQAPNSYYRNDTREGTITGAGIGAIAGALIGGKKNAEGGALIGAGLGALTGHTLGKARDDADMQQVAVGTSMAANANAQVAARAVSNYDLIQMSQAGLSDDLIISTIQTRGGRFDMSPNSLISLKQAGVSDRVVMEAQRAASVTMATPINPAPPTVRVVPAPTVYVRPAPVIRVYHGYHGPVPHHYHGHW
ncbi:YMGG-like glycine zipper-containing protein [Aeoliella mucimassa]|uniref:YMGG-like glycine zipper-containing protein n=1 Tax=Aeoliella mucimassa TaxID=2527972 RepID=UPI0018D3E35C|nr:YMGG-like glycine zipper-containing protein [Aeoliella mucimassa]